MRKTSLRLSLAFLFLAALPLGCAESPSSPPKGSGGSGGSSNRTGGSGGGSTASGGSGVTSTGTGGGAGSGGSATGGASGGAGGGGATTSGTGGSMGGSPGSGGSASSGGTTTATGGSGHGGSGGSATGGAGGTFVGGAGGTSTGHGGSGGTGGGTGSVGPDAGDGGGGNDDTGGADTEPLSCEDKKTNGDEIDIDCGGTTCPKCGAGKTCKADGDCKSGSCATGKCADPFASTGTVSNNGNIWRITVGTTILEVQTGGGKIVTFSLDDTNMLVINSSECNGSNGSVFWIAPQAEWITDTGGWPPPSEMDENATFTANSQGNVLTMAGPVGPKDGFSISKRFWGNVEHQTVTIEYTIKNGSTAEVKKAPWEITRVCPFGLTFFPNAEDPVRLPGTSNSFLAVPFTTGGGAAWFKYPKDSTDPSWFTQDIKGGADGLEGWAAHINCGTGLAKTCASSAKSMVLIKEWDDTTTQTPGEKEVEIYAAAGHNYVEFEQQGNYQSIPAGGTLVWTMHWMLRYLPTNLAPTPGSADLMTWVRGQLL
jgi:hypothetical protein